MTSASNDAAPVDREGWIPPFPSTRPLWAIIGVVFGTVGAAMLVPDHGYYLAGTLVLPGIVMAVGLLLGVVVAVMANPLSVFRAEHLLMIGLVFWVVLDAAQGSYHLVGIGYEAMRTVFLAIGLMALGIWGGSVAAALFLPPVNYSRASEAKVADLGVRFLFAAGVVCFILGMLRVFIGCGVSPGCYANAFFAPRYEAQWQQADYYASQIVALMRFFGYLVLPIAAVLLHLERRLSGRVVALGVLGTLFLLILMTGGGRRQVGAVLALAGVVWVLLDGRFRWKHLLAMAAGIFVTLVIMQAMLAWRYVGLGTALMQGMTMQLDERSGIAVDRNLRYLSYAVQIVPERHPHTGWTGVYFVAAGPIPRTLLPNKPRSRGIDLPRQIGERRGPGFSWTASAVGDLYLIRGLPAVAAGGVLFGVLSNLASRLLAGPVIMRRRLLYGLAAVVLFVSLRALHELTIMGLTFVGFIGLLWLRNRFLVRRKPAPSMDELLARP